MKTSLKPNKKRGKIRSHHHEHQIGQFGLLYWRTSSIHPSVHLSLIDSHSIVIRFNRFEVVIVFCESNPLRNAKYSKIKNKIIEESLCEQVKSISVLDISLFK